MNSSSSIQFMIRRVSWNRVSLEVEPSTIIIASSLLSYRNAVARHPPARFVIPVFMPNTSFFYRSLLVLDQKIYLFCTFP